MTFVLDGSAVLLHGHMIWLSTAVKPCCADSVCVPMSLSCGLLSDDGDMLRPVCTHLKLSPLSCGVTAGPMHATWPPICPDVPFARRSLPVLLLSRARTRLASSAPSLRNFPPELACQTAYQACSRMHTHCSQAHNCTSFAAWPGTTNFIAALHGAAQSSTSLTASCAIFETSRTTSTAAAALPTAQCIDLLVGFCGKSSCGRDYADHAERGIYRWRWQHTTIDDTCRPDGCTSVSSHCIAYHASSNWQEQSGQLLSTQCASSRSRYSRHGIAARHAHAKQCIAHF